MRGEETGDHTRVAHGCSAAGKCMPCEGGQTAANMMASRLRLQPCRKCSFMFDICSLRRSFLLVAFVVLLLHGAKAENLNAKGFQRNLESFFCSVDQDGNGEIEQGEATKFLRSLDAQMADEDEAETKEGISDLLASAHFEYNFSYGGNTISAEEMLDHLSSMMTANHVVDWVTHGLELPQYADVFRQNAINGMDFPALIRNDSEALADDLGIKSTLHRTKITHALVRQVFGIGTVPGPIRSLQCTPSSYGGTHLLWEAPSNQGVPPLHKYLIDRWSKTLSTWIHVAGTRETAYLDTNAVKLGKNYTYRVQTWGGHGPSDWVRIDGCRADSTSFTSSEIDTELPSVKQMTKVPENSESELLTPRDSQRIHSTENSLWTWINSGLVLVLALCSRHTFFFDVTSAAWVLLKEHLRRTLRHGVESPHLCVRTVARCIALGCDSWAYMQHKVWTVSRFGVESRMGSGRPMLRSLSEPCLKSPHEIEEELNGNSFEPHNARSLSADSLLGEKGIVTPSFGDLRGSSPSSSEPEGELEEEVGKGALSLPSTSPREIEISAPPAKRSKNRCNHEGCKVRFDRWHYLQDWWMKLNKHYCRECQSVFCVRHTRISPHGPRGQCGLDSSCYCFNCFSGLPSESKRRLEEVNKLRVGPVNSESTSASMSKSASSGSLKQKVSSLSNSTVGLPLSLSDTVEPFLDNNDLLDFREAPVGVSKAASDSGMPDELSERLVADNGHMTASKSGHSRQRSCA